jgi:hypothetical protein
VAGAIAWATALLARQRRTVARLRELPAALFDAGDGAALRAEFVAFAADVDGFARQKFAAWAAGAVAFRDASDGLWTAEVRVARGGWITWKSMAGASWDGA